MRILHPKGNRFLSYHNNQEQEQIRHFNCNSQHPRDDDGYESDESQGNESGKELLHDHHQALVDEDYLMVGNYVEEHIRQRIENGEYVDFARLLPRDQLLMEEEGRLEIINRNRRTFFVPATDSADSGGISNFSQEQAFFWEQAFRVFSTIYTRRFLGRAAELIQYNHIIHTAALIYTWENVYLYDQDFRLHLSHYPSRSWLVILQQAWTMRLKDRNRADNEVILQEAWTMRLKDRNRADNDNNSKNSGSRSKSKKDVCWHYNAGRCTYGSSCKFEHRCAICNKFGHSAHICHKANSGGVDYSHNHQNGNGNENSGSGSGNSGSGGSKNWYENKNNNNYYDKGNKSDWKSAHYNYYRK